MSLGHALLLCCLLCSCRRQQALPSSGPRQTLEGLTLSQSRRGVADWRLKARTAVLREEEKLAVLSGPEIEFLQAGRVVSRARSRRGTVRTDTHDIALESSVVLESLEDQSVLETDRLDYSSKTGRFQTRSEVLVTRPEGVLRGQGLEAKPDLSQVRIFNQKSVIKAGQR